MKTHSQKTTRIIDVVLLVGFLLSFSLGFSGVELHPWLGLVLSALIIYHLWAHRAWVCAVTQQLAQAPARALLCWLVDAGLAAGFVLIMASGLVLSSWLDDVWLDFHLTISITTVGLIVLKVGLHWRWIINAFAIRL